MNTTKLTSAVEEYLSDLRKIRASGGATDERSYYPPLTNLLNAIGGMLKPKLFCVGELARGAPAILTSVSMLLAKPGIAGRGRALDNVFCEHLWRSLRHENIFLNRYDTVPQLQTDLSDYFDSYNHERTHQASTTAHPQKSASCSDQSRPHPSGLSFFSHSVV